MIGLLTFDLFYIALVESPHPAGLVQEERDIYRISVIVQDCISMLKYWVSASKLVIHWVFLSAGNLRSDHS
jgi:hypothetical protein